MTYSCGIHTGPGESLEQAQLNKIDAVGGRGQAPGLSSLPACGVLRPGALPCARGAAFTRHACDANRWHAPAAGQRISTAKQARASRKRRGPHPSQRPQIIDAANIGRDDSVLEIGCGWGAFAIRAVQRTGCR
jgi:hypothetical protein